MKFNTITAKTFFIILIFALSAVSILTGCRKSSPQPPQPSQNVQREPNAPVSPNLKSIIAAASSWGPILSSFYGKQMPDFTVTDITGKTQKLSDYRGKEVMVVFWATWCMPCQQEIPHLIALRDIFSTDKLAILAISNESADIVKAMADDKNMTYTVISYKSALPEPFSSIRGFPSAFFIKPDGTLKICTEGGLQLGEMKSIILAQ
ncbi:MAG: TlpA disulfide reductase family protein [Phycisphaerae bacterium]|jgi:peroxiredoxin